MTEHAPYLFVEFFGRLVQVNRNGDVRLTGSVLPHVLRFLVEAGIDCVVLIPGNETAGSGGFGIHQPVADAGNIFFSEVSRPRVLVAFAGIVHFLRVMDQLPKHRMARPSLFELSTCFCVRKFLRLLLDAIGNFNLHFPIDGCFQFLVTDVLHPHLGVFLSIEVVVHAHPLIQIRRENLVKGGWQKLVLSFQTCQSRADRNRSGCFIVGDQKQLLGCVFSASI